MTYAMWGIVIGMALMFGVSFYRYKHRPCTSSSPSGRPDSARKTDCANVMACSCGIT
jgi:hypothetical protein